MKEFPSPPTPITPIADGLEVASERQYARRITNKRDEQERVQKKVFGNWINSHIPGCIQNDLVEELKDGTKLLALLEVLTGQKLPGERGRRLRRPHFISNVNIALELLERRRVKLVNTHPTDIVDGNPSIVLGLIWVIILHFHIQEYFKLASLEQLPYDLRAQSPYLSSPSPGSTSPVLLPTSRASAVLKRALLDYLNTRFKLSINDFTSSWRSGESFLLLIEALMPGIQAVEKGQALSGNQERLQLAFDLAHQLLGIPALFDPEDIDVSSPDERSIMTYVCQFMQKETVLTKESSPSSAESEEIVSLKHWTETVLRTGISSTTVKQLVKEYSKHKHIFQKHESNIEPHAAANWQLIENELFVGKQVMEWIVEAENLMKSYLIPQSSDQVERQLNEHREFFSALPTLENPSHLLVEISGQFQNTISLASEWEAAMVEASDRWLRYKLTKESLKSWLLSAGKKLQPGYDSLTEKQERLDHLKDFFGSAQGNEAILNDFIHSCDDVLTTLPESCHVPLRITLKALETKWTEINDVRAPQHLITMEFELLEHAAERLIKSNPHDAAIGDLYDSMSSLAKDFYSRFQNPTFIDRANLVFDKIGVANNTSVSKNDHTTKKKNSRHRLSIIDESVETISLHTKIDVVGHHEDRNSQGERVTSSRQATEGIGTSEQVEVSANSLFGQLYRKQLSSDPMISQSTIETINGVVTLSDNLELPDLNLSDVAAKEVEESVSSLEADNQEQVTEIPLIVIDEVVTFPKLVEIGDENDNHEFNTGENTIVDDISKTESISVEEEVNSERETLTRVNAQITGQEPLSHSLDMQRETNIELEKVEMVVDEEDDDSDALIERPEKISLQPRRVNKTAATASSKARRVADIIGRLNKIHDWLSHHSIDEFKGTEMTSIDKTTLEKALARKADFEEKRSEMRDIYEDLKVDADETAVDLYSAFVQEIEYSDWDSVLVDVRQHLKESWLEDSQQLVTSTQGILKRNDVSRKDVIEVIAAVSEALENLAQLKTSKISTDSVGERITQLDKLLSDLSTKRTELSVKQSLIRKFDKEMQPFKRWVDEADTALADAVRFTDVQSMKRAIARLLCLAVDIKSKNDAKNRLDQLSAVLQLDSSDDPNLAERRNLSNEVNSKWSKITKVCSKKMASFEKLREVYAKCSKRFSEVNTLVSDAEPNSNYVSISIHEEAKTLCEDFVRTEKEIRKTLSDVNELSDSFPNDCKERCDSWYSNSSQLMKRYDLLTTKRSKLLAAIANYSATNSDLTMAIAHVNSFSDSDKKLVEVNQLLSSIDDGSLSFELYEKLSNIVSDMSVTDKEEIVRRIDGIQSEKVSLQHTLSEMRETLEQECSTLSTLNDHLDSATKTLDEVDVILKPPLSPIVEEVPWQLQATQISGMNFTVAPLTAESLDNRRNLESSKLMSGDFMDTRLNGREKLSWVQEVSSRADDVSSEELNHKEDCWESSVEDSRLERDVGFNSPEVCENSAFNRLDDKDLENSNETRKVLELVKTKRKTTKTRGFFSRALRASLPLQVLMLILTGAASLIPISGDDYCCQLVNNLARSLEPMLNYPHGPVPM
ncbi:Nesprin-1 [Halotydeus destructor]|nr:Nesprin-1 [Halotydeus destructor]